MIRASGLTVRRGSKVLLDQTEFVVHPGERVGFVGKNGAGKSTLFALLQHEIEADAGTLEVPQGWRMASVKQEIAASNDSAREFVIDGDTHLRALQHERRELSEALENEPERSEALGARIAELESELIEAGAWTSASRAEQLLAGLGFSPNQWSHPVDSFSGGWRMRLALARALMAPSELLLLDEPTNHLDLDAMLWLERWLGSYPGTVLLISHDTEFLDAVAQTILHFDQGKLNRYKGGYQDFVIQRSERLRQTKIAWERQTRETARLQGFIDRFKAKASKAKQAQSRVKALARMELLAPIHAESGIDIRIPSPEEMPDPLLVLDDMQAGYTNDQGVKIPILQNVRLMVRGGDRIGILGVNGAGKSTLVKTLAGELEVQAGSRNASRGLEVGYFAQHQLDMLDLESSPLQHLARIAPQTREQELRNYLGGFGFGGDRVMDKVAPMSGGEKARLALSLIVWQKPNLLLLDEPSNHLDVETREALTTALAEFGGSMLLVSHDRHLLRTTVDRFWIVADGSVQEFDGDLEDYRDWLAEHQANAKKQETSSNATIGAELTSADRKQQKRDEAQERQRTSALKKPIEAKLVKIEKELESIQNQLKTLDMVIADPDLYTDSRRQERVQTLAQHGELTKRHDELEEIWLELQSELESIGMNTNS
ncbi:ABC-F family ATP-binding cassette domain-containing protein [Zwartia panacis]|uniref:ABC-F family ATP-binding cassette domain-containing protein n=1 Tax=Zwartia panacis TaxID=2683345 RepID=UPI0025B4FEC0|nr:ATP-binding cassette domain-containing protein [Zwartia panacis]MDN4016927.1 ATP-binding cassette domain-containing protein [Zwartia panacis]